MIRMAGWARLAVPAVVGLVLLAAPAEVQAQAGSQFDGVWTVRMEKGEGTCGASRTVAVEVAGGRVTYAGTEPVTATGTVPDSGRVRLRFQHGNDILEVQGSVSGNVGWGSWRSPSGRCAGGWSARRS